MSDVIKPERPIKLALIGTGFRSQFVYEHVWRFIKPWIEVVAVCDPVKENCSAMAEKLGVPGYDDIRQLVKDRPMEAALVVTPIPSHYPISMFLSENNIHNLTETTWASMYCQAKDMADTARKNHVVARVAENFFRFPVDRFAQTVRDSGYLGRIGRVFSYADHTGYHNNSRWIVFAGSHPDWVQSIEHFMLHPAFYSTPQRLHNSEKLNARFFHFPGDFAVMDVGSGYAKGFLGRHPRPGYTEWQGELGTFVNTVGGATWGVDYAMELRKVSDSKLADAQVARGDLYGGGIADIISPARIVMDDYAWISVTAETPEGIIEYRNPFPFKLQTEHLNPWYLAPVISHLVDFALAVRGLRDSEFTDQDALASEMMEIGARESSLHEGRRIKLPIEGELESDSIERRKLQEQFGADPMDIDAMLSISYPKP